MHGPLDSEHALGRLEGAIGPLVPGRRYAVGRDFRDFDGDLHARGEGWVFLGHTSLPSGEGCSLFVRLPDGGVFVIRLLDDPEHQGDVLALPSAYFLET
ncbi:DUF3601 domain-containing protein [Candidatus Fermentibacteria bacterium]|nr:DUF3601 domain-containing protein [Candidatus Fermentibacteria bacterium]